VRDIVWATYSIEKALFTFTLGSEREAAMSGGCLREVADVGVVHGLERAELTRPS